MNRRGFTVTELIITITIMAILMVLSFVSLENSQINARDVERKSDISTIAKSLDNFYSTGTDGNTNIGRYPSTAITSSGSLSVQVLVVGGGGGGGSGAGSGGGAGGYVYNPSFNISSQSQAYPVTIGAGGSGGSGGHLITNSGTKGGSSTFSSITAEGGGAGVKRGCFAGGNGGSGGGGSLSSTACALLGGTASQGNIGGAGFVASSFAGGAGGGGGAGGAGAAGSNSPGSGNGGIGLANTITGSSVYYAGGGGGSKYSFGTSVGTGGLGGGGTANGSGAGGAGGANTGGGGAGGAHVGNTGHVGGAGGSGVVIIAYPLNSISATGGIVTISGGYMIHTFIATGEFRLNEQRLLRDLDIKSLTAPGVTDPNVTFKPATNNIQSAAGVLPQPTIDQYVYQPLQGDGTLCTSEAQECRKFNLYYRTESDGVVQMVVSKNQ